MREIQALLWIIADKKKKLDYLRSRPENQKPERAAIIDELDRVVSEEHDVAIPWLFRELTKKRLVLTPSRRDIETMGGAFRDYLLHRGYFPDQFIGHLADWMAQKRPNIMSMDTEAVIAALYDWDEELGKNEEIAKQEQYEEREVVHEFDDGWTIQRVRTTHDLKLEGEKMGHCVGGYCYQVSSGHSFIYSLRDPRNQPHVTIELNGDHTVENSRTVQIQGKEDKTPKAEYSQRVSEWLESVGLPTMKVSALARQLGMEEIYGAYGNDNYFSDDSSNLEQWAHELGKENPDETIYQDFDAVLLRYATEATGQSAPLFVDYLNEVSDFNTLIPTISEIGFYGRRPTLDIGDLRKDWTDWIDNADTPDGLTVGRAVEEWLSDEFGINVTEDGYVSGDLSEILDDDDRRGYHSDNRLDEFLNSETLQDFERQREDGKFEDARRRRQEVLWALVMICDPQGPVVQAFADQAAEGGRQVTRPNPNQMELPFDARRAFAELLGLCSMEG